MKEYISKVPELVAAYAPKAVLAIVVLIVGLFIVNRVVNLFRNYLIEKNSEKTLVNFLCSLLGILLKTLLLISVASMVGIATTSFVAVLGALSLAVGLALQGSLANFAGGALILLFKPFKVGDIIDAQGHTGVVKDIQIFTTHLLTPQNRRVIIPNGPLSNGNITNLTAEDIIRVDIVVGIGYGENIQKAREIILNVMNNHPKVLKSPEPSVNVSSLGESSVDLLLLPYGKPSDFWNIKFQIQEQVKMSLDNANIEIPFPQRVVHQA